MMIENLSLVDKDSPILTTKSSLIKQCSSLELTELSGAMLELMRKLGGVGLACPQIGLNIRMFVMSSPVHSGSVFHKDRICINPVLESWNLQHEERIESCLSLPDTCVNIARPEKIMVSYYDNKWNYHTEDLEGINARIFQHELDHLDGILITRYNDNIFSRTG